MDFAVDPGRHLPNDPCRRVEDFRLCGVPNPPLSRSTGVRISLSLCAGGAGEARALGATLAHLGVADQGGGRDPSPHSHLPAAQPNTHHVSAHARFQRAVDVHEMSWLDARCRSGVFASRHRQRMGPSHPVVTHGADAVVAMVCLRYQRRGKCGDLVFRSALLRPPHLLKPSACIQMSALPKMERSSPLGFIL
jgi:hypothetical protein